MDPCGVRLAWKKEVLPLSFCLLLKHWAFPREKQGGWEGEKYNKERMRRVRENKKQGEEQGAADRKTWWVPELFLATHAVIKKKHNTEENSTCYIETERSNLSCDKHIPLYPLLKHFACVHKYLSKFRSSSCWLNRTVQRYWRGILFLLARDTVHVQDSEV